jgi:hypothetical protein
MKIKCYFCGYLITLLPNEKAGSIIECSKCRKKLRLVDDNGEFELEEFNG